jgi:hypothetical protein
MKHIDRILRPEYPHEDDIDLNDKNTTWIAIYDVVTDPIPKHLYEKANGDPYATLEKLYDAQYIRDNEILDFIPEGRIVGLRFRRTFKSDTGFNKIPYCGDQIERILFDDNGEHILYLGECERKISVNEYLNLPITYKDDYYIRGFYGSITVIYIAYLEEHLGGAIDNYVPGGSTSISTFLSVD